MYDHLDLGLMEGWKRVGNDRCVVGSCTWMEEEDQGELGGEPRGLIGAEGGQKGSRVGTMPCLLCFFKEYHIAVCSTGNLVRTYCSMIFSLLYEAAMVWGRLDRQNRARH
jgi:hypothetical protein